MTTIPVKKSAHSKKQLHESVTEKLHDAISDFAHMVHEIEFKKIVAKAAKVVSDSLHMGKTKTKKAAKKKVASTITKKAVPAAKKAVKKAIPTAKKVLKKAADAARKKVAPKKTAKKK